MPIIGTHSPGGPGGSASSNQWSLLDEILTPLPDNTGNLIVAKNIRDSVYTLWERIEDVNVIAASAASASMRFTNPEPTLNTIGGIPAGSTFSNVDLVDMWEMLLYPYVGPLCGYTTTPNPTIKEYGSPTSITVNWTVTKKSKPIYSITLNGSSVTPTGNNQSGNITFNGTYSLPAANSTTNIFSLIVDDGEGKPNSISTSNFNLTWMNKIYWGSISLTGNPNLTTNPGSASSVGAECTDIKILALSNKLSITKSNTYLGINGSGNHLIFAWPSNLSGAFSPTFQVNGLPNSAFTRVRTNSPFINSYGFTTNYEVWVSNTSQSSPLNIIIT